MRVLIQCGDNLENSVRVLSLASLLRDHGAHPVVVTYTPRYGAFFAAYGVETVDFYRFRNARPTQDQAHRFDFDPDLDDQIALDARRARLGGQSIDEERARAAALRALVASDRMARELSADAMIVWNGRTGAIANAWRRVKHAHGLPGGFIERGLLPGGVIFDPQGVNGDASFAQGFGAASDATLAALCARHDSALARWFPMLDEKRFAAPRARRRAVLAPLQVQRDSNIVLHSPRVKSMRRLVMEARWIRDAAFPDHDIEIRPHPEEDPAERLNLPVIDRAAFKPGGSLSDWLSGAPVVVTVNSTVGLEAALLGCAPIVLGEGVYCRENFVVRADDADLCALRDRVGAILDDPHAQRQRLTRYLARLLDGHQVQPLSPSRSLPTALLALFGGGGAGATQGATPPVEALRRALPPSGPVRVHVVGLSRVRLTLNYRETNAPLTAKAIAMGLRPLIGDHRDIALEARAAPDVGDIVLLPRGRRAPDCAGYAVVLDETFAPHPAH